MYKIRNKMVKKQKKSLFLPNCLRILIFLCNFAPNFFGRERTTRKRVHIIIVRYTKYKTLREFDFFLYFFIFP